MATIFLFYFSCTDNNLKSDLDSSNARVENRNLLCDEVPCIYTLIPKSKIYLINGCSITVNYSLIQCENNNLIHWFGVRDFSYTIAESSPCRNVKQLWNQHYLAGETLEANLAINEFYRTLTLMVQADIISSLNPDDHKDGTVHFEWIETKCHTLCAKEITFEDLPSYFDISYSVCGYKCCVRGTKYKVINGIFVQNGPVTIDETYPAYPCEPLPVKCLDGALPWGNDCQPACNRL